MYVQPLVLIASDDHSTDSTLRILSDFQKRSRVNPVTLIQGPAVGFAGNFMALTRYAQGWADCYAWSDQDDIRHEDKLERAVAWLRRGPADVPALYCGRTQLVSEENNELGLSVLFSRKPTFANALMQNIGGGNTMVFNEAACRLLAKTFVGTEVVAHDWWAYIIIMGAGGRVFYDANPCLRYRQHGQNLIGSNVGWSARMVRVRKLFEGRLKDWNETNIRALEQHIECLTPENRKILYDYARARQSALPRRLLEVRRCGVHRQTLLGNLGLLLAVVLKKI
ncbi:glycosyltransferase [Achromobacter sp. F4_2707]|uniref:glycosyltransferase n=1 Tax=Achromobacter sp. F4_2707 TaxID=3114286 RepID=UPI0039C681F7